MAKDPRPIRSQPLWVRVDGNRLRLGAFVALYVTGSALLLASALVAVPGALIGVLLVENPSAGYWDSFFTAWAVAVVVLLFLGGLYAAIQLSNAEHWVRGRLAARELGPEEAPELVSAVHDMALAAGLEAPPRIVVTAGGPSDVNAFALGTTRSRPLIGVTPGFLSMLSVAEERAVVAALIARIIAGDIMFGTALAALMGPLKAIRESPSFASKGCAGGGGTGTGEPAGAGGDKEKSGGGTGCGDGCGDGCTDVDIGDRAGYLIIVVIVIVVLTYVAVLSSAWIVTVWGRLLQRTSHEKSDAEGMLLLKDPAPMLSAFRKTARASNLVAGLDPSYDGIFYAATSGTPRIERVEQRRYLRLREVVGVDGLAAEELRLGVEDEGAPLGTEDRAVQQLAPPEPLGPPRPPEPPEPPEPPVWPPPPTGPEPFDETREGGGSRDPGSPPA